MKYRVLNEAFIKILEIDTKKRLETKCGVIFSSYFFIYVKNILEILHKSFIYDALVPISCISVSWTLAAHLVFSSYVCCLQNTGFPKSLKLMTKKPVNKELLLM